MAVRFDDWSMWVDLDDGRTLGVPLAWFPRLLRAFAGAARRGHYQSKRPPLGGARRGHLYRWPAGGTWGYDWRARDDGAVAGSARFQGPRFGLRFRLEANLERARHNHQR